LTRIFILQRNPHRPICCFYDEDDNNNDGRKKKVERKNEESTQAVSIQTGISYRNEIDEMIYYKS